MSEICWIGAEENYVRICTKSETHLLRETMAHLEEKLDPSTFLRVHRSSIVNLQYVKEVRPEIDGEYGVLLNNGQKDIDEPRAYLVLASKYWLRVPLIAFIHNLK